MMKTIYKKIYDDLVEHEDKKSAKKDKKYHKYEGHRSFGIKAPILDKLLKKHKIEVNGLSCKEAFTLARMLYTNKIEETTLAGNFVLQSRINCIDKEQLSFLDKILDYFTSWSQTDDLCVDVLQTILLKFPSETLLMLKKWNHSKNMWKRRASVVVFVRKVGESGKFTKEALELCENLIWDKEDLVQKGVGWCLKDIMRANRRDVYDYIKTLRKRGVSSTIILYAIRDLKGAERKIILEIPITKSVNGVVIGKGNLAGKGVMLIEILERVKLL